LSEAYLTSDRDPECSGELNLGFTREDIEDNVAENRRRFLSHLVGESPFRLVTVRQFHSNVAAVISNTNPAATQDADGMMTQVHGMVLGILTADCIPVLVADPQRRVVAAFHAGWRGTVTRVVELGIEKMRREFGSNPNHLVAAIGPGIRSCCYVVGEEVIGRFGSEFGYADALVSTKVNGLGFYLDLVQANRRQLLDAGVQPESIDLIGDCTSCRADIFFSHRQSGGRAGRMMAAIGIQSA